MHLGGVAPGEVGRGKGPVATHPGSESYYESRTTTNAPVDVGRMCLLYGQSTCDLEHNYGEYGSSSTTIANSRMKLSGTFGTFGTFLLSAFPGIELFSALQPLHLSLGVHIVFVNDPCALACSLLRCYKVFSSY